MAKTPRTRHSKTKQEPVTIDLEADAVRRETGEDEDSKETAKAAEEENTETGGAEADPAETGMPVQENQGSSSDDTDAPASDEQEGDGSGPNEDGAADREDQQQEEMPARSETVKRGGSGLGLLAGVAGGVIAIALAGGLQWAGVLPAPRANGPDPAVDALRQDLASVQNSVSQLRQAAPDSAASDQISQLENQLAQLQDTVTQLQSAPAGGAGGQEDNGLAERVSQIESRVENATQAAESAQQAATGNAQQLESLASQVAQFGERLATQGEGPQLAPIVAALALKSAVDSGQSFSTELQAYNALAGDASAVESLKPFADTGIPTRVELASEASEIASQIAGAGSQAPQDANVLDRLLAGARSAVTVRPVGDAEGNSPEAVAARMEAAVQRGDYAQALTAYEALPPEAQEAAGSFADKLRARQAADQVVEKALSGALQPA